MAKQKQNSSRVISLVLTIVFALLVAVIGYATFKGGSFEFRSKAASEDVVIQQWTFDTEAEGWSAMDVASWVVKGGNFSFVVKDKASRVERYEKCKKKSNGKEVCNTATRTIQFTPGIGLKNAKVTLSYPVNTFQIRLAISVPSSGPTCVMPPVCAYLKNPCKFAQQGVVYCPLHATKDGGENIGKVTVPHPAPVIEVPIEISYRLKGKTAFQKLASLTARSDGAMHDFSLDFPEKLSLKQIVELKVSFAALRKNANAKVDIDEIRIVGQKEVKPIVSPTPPSPSRTFFGVLTKVTGEGGENSELRSPYRLQISDASAVNQIYQLVSLQENSSCPLGKLCTLIGGTVKVINFDEFVGKQVEVTGTVEPMPDTNDSESVAGTQDEGVSLPIIYVTNIQRISDAVPTTTPAAGCYYQPVKCVKAPCNPILVCPTGAAAYTCPASEWVNCMPGPNAGVRLECASEYLAWAQTHCSGFKGAAY